ncbi:acetate--CoA ligase family protein [Candidimonas humi]|uniref:Acetate--CoA ligase family protein n=1 Tax=Candidimonas humi TaxID=683355 RepID=A0ABV8P356_9BURK|nr:acetate--CoA ligase family protein [Candidimonas humi]MBV6307249.1 acetate--CoA ligase family protein [Candidimonas humi]
MNAISRLIKPQSIAVIGASSDLSKTAGKPVAYLLKHGYAGRIYPVNPTAREIAGLASYPDIASLPEAPDAAIVMLGAAKAVPAVRELAAIGTGSAIVLASGYAELGAQGANLQDELRQAAGAMRLLGPNTIGLVNVTDGITLSASSALEADAPPQGSIALVSQSGGILGSLLSRAAAQGIGFSKLVATGNEADLDVADFVDALVDDEATHVIALYLESLRHPAAFRRAALRARAAGKPIVAFKVGRSESGARSAVSHTGAMAGSDRMYDALFAETGVLRVREFAELLGVPQGLATRRALRGQRIAILTSTGGAGTLVADSLGLAGFDTPVPDEATAQELRAVQGATPTVLDRNPIDVTLAGLDPKLLRSAITSLMKSEGYDGVVIIVGSSALARPTLMASAIEDCLHISGKPVLTYVSPDAPHILAQLNRRGIPAYASPEACAAVFQALWASGRVAAQPQAETARQAPPPADPLSGLPDGSLDEAQAKRLFAAYGIPATREIVAATAEDAERAARELGGRVALKLLSRDITHKSDVGGVALGLDAATMADAARSMAQAVQARTGSKPEAFLVQEMVSGGHELILGLARDPLGTAILLGTGGTQAELLQDTVLAMQPLQRPLDRAEAEAMLRALKFWPLLDGYRGAPPRDTEAAISAIVAFSTMVHALGPRLQEAEINPLFVKARGQGVVAADAVAVLAPATEA